VIVLINLMWGLNIIAAKMAVDIVSPLTAAFLRQLMVGLLCLPFLRVVPGRMKLVIGFALANGAFFLIPLNLALRIADNVAAIAISGQLNVPFAVILSVIFLGERIHFPRIVGLVMAFAGVAILGFDPAIVGEVPALLLNILSAFIFACGSLFARQLQGVPLATLYAWLGLTGTLAIGVLALLTEPAAMANIPYLPGAAWGWIAFSAVGSSLIGHGGLAWMIQRHPIGTVMPYVLIAPVVSVIVSAIMFDTPVTGMMLLGGVIVLMGVAIVTIRTAQRGTLVEELS
jgi:O-acetylserine/cysteine efflux transporter